MDWKVVGEWLKQNAGTGAALVGSLIAGNVPGAVAAGISIVSSAAGTSDPTKALEQLQTDPTTMVKLKELAVKEADSIRAHIQSMEALRLEDVQKEHEQTQLTIRSGDNSQDVVVRRTRPLQSWASLLAAFAYTFTRSTVTDMDLYVIGLLLTLPWAYAGLRQVGKGFDSFAAARAKK